MQVCGLSDGYFLCGLTSNIHVLLIARFIQGTAITSMVIAGYSTIHAMYEQHRAIKTLALMGSITVLAPATGPLLGSLVLLVASWRWIFYLLAIWAGLILLGLYKIMPETCDGTASLHPMALIKQYGATIKNWRFVQPVLCITLSFAAMIAWITAGPFLIMEQFKYSAQVFGVLQCLVFGSLIAGNRCINYLMKKYSLAALMHSSLLLGLIAGVSAIMLSTIAGNYLFDIVFPMMLLAFGSGIGFPIFNRLAIEASDQPIGIKMALFASAMSMGGLGGSAVISSLYTGNVFGFALIIFGFSLVAMLVGFKVQEPHS